MGKLRQLKDGFVFFGGKVVKEKVHWVYRTVIFMHFIMQGEGAVDLPELPTVPIS
jgi:hypothetical protein